VKVLNPFAPDWYTPKDEQTAPSPARFKLRGLDGNQLGYVAPEMRVDERGQIAGMSGKGIELALAYGLVDWEGIENDRGPVAFAPANFALLPFDLRTELAMQVLIRSVPSEAEKKT
jgi:hypothetical protein